MINKILQVFLKVNADTKGAEQGLKGVQEEAEKAKKAVKGVGDEGKKSMEGLSDIADNAKESLDGLTGGAVSGFGKLRAGVGNAIKAFTTLKGAVAATGIGLLLVAIVSLISYFKNSEEGSRKLAIATEALGIIFNKIQEVLAVVGEKLVSVFSNPQESLKKLGELIKENIENRINGMLELLPALGRAIKLAFEGEFAEAGKVAVDAIGKASLGVENVTDKALEMGQAVKDGFNTIVDETNKAIQAATKLVDAQRGARDLQQALIVQNAQLTKDLEGQKKIAEDTTLTYEERGKALDEVDKIQVKLAKNLVAQASAEENILRMQIANTANYEEREELETQLAQKQAERIGLETQLQTVEQESGKLRRELLKEREEGLKAIQDQIFAVEQASKEAFGQSEKEKLEIKKKADIELINLEEQNALKEAQRLEASEEQKQAIRDAYAQQRLATEKLTAEQITAIDKEAAQQVLDLQKETAGIINGLLGDERAVLKAQNDQALADIEARKVAAIDAAKLKGQDTTAIEAEYLNLSAAQLEANARAEMMLDESIKQNKIALASSTLGAVAGLFAEGSKAYKAFAVSQAIMDTYGAISATLKSAAANPTSILFPAFPYIQSAIMAAQGFANVKKILSVKPGGTTSGAAATSAPATSSAPVLPQLAQGTTVQANQIGQAVAAQLSNTPIKTYVSTKDLNTAGEFNRLQTGAARL